MSARLTVDLIPELTIVVHREDLSPESAFEQVVEEAEDLGEFTDLQAELEAEEAEELTEEGEEQSLEENGQALDAEGQAGEGEEQGELEGQSGGEDSVVEEIEVEAIAPEEEVGTDEPS